MPPRRAAAIAESCPETCKAAEADSRVRPEDARKTSLLQCDGNEPHVHGQTGQKILKKT